MAVTELRIYQIKPELKDTWAKVFTLEDLPLSESYGAKIVGYFWNTEKPGEFVWIRQWPNAAAQKRQGDALHNDQRFKDMLAHAQGAVISTEVRNLGDVWPA